MGLGRPSPFKIKAMYVTVGEIKEHLNISASYTEEDTMLNSMIEASEIAVENYLQQPIDTFVIENKLNAALKHAIKIMVGNFYANRESVAYTNPQPVPYTLEFLLKPYRKYS